MLFNEFCRWNVLKLTDMLVFFLQCDSQFLFISSPGSLLSPSTTGSRGRYCHAKATRAGQGAATTHRWEGGTLGNFCGCDFKFSFGPLPKQSMNSGVLQWYKRHGTYWFQHAGHQSKNPDDIEWSHLKERACCQKVAPFRRHWIWKLETPRIPQEAQTSFRIIKNHKGVV